MSLPHLRSSATEHVPKQLKILFALVISVLALGVAGYVALEGKDVTGAFVATVETLAHISKAGGYTQPIQHEGFQIIMQLFGVIIVWFAIWAAFDLAVAGKFEAYFKEVKEMAQISKLKDHFIVCGAGRVGKNVGLRLKQRGKTVLFIEKDKDVIDRLRSQGFLVMDVGPIDEHVLMQAGVQRAQGLVASLGDDSKNLLLVLTAREINPKLTIAVRVNNAKLIQKFKRAGANLLIIPEAIGGARLADALLGDLSNDVIVGEQ